MRGFVTRGRTDIERAMAAALTDARVGYVEQKRIGPYFADFYLPAQNAVIEVDGIYWHRLRKARDAQRDAYMRACGYQVFRFDEWAVKQSPAGCVREATRPRIGQ